MQSNISIKNEASHCVIDIEGTIGIPEEWQFEHPDQRVATYETFRRTVRSIADLKEREIVVNIRSTGGDVNDALLIYEALRETGARITTRCYGYTASAATLIAQAASEGCRELAAGALYLIHNSICATEGNAEELTAQTELLRKTDARLAELYAARSGRPVEVFTALMAENSGRGRWLSPEEALEAGLADAVIEQFPATAAAGESPEGSVRDRLVRGWQRLVAALGSETPCAETDRNILHFGAPEEARQAASQLVRSERMRQTEPTRTLPREDPATREALCSANAAAYAADARRLSLKL